MESPSSNSSPAASFSNIIQQLSAKQNQWFNYIALNGRLESPTDLLAAVRSATLSFCLASKKNGKHETFFSNKDYAECTKTIAELFSPVFEYPHFSLFVNDHGGVVLQRGVIDLFVVDKGIFEKYTTYLSEIVNS